MKPFAAILFFIASTTTNAQPIYNTDSSQIVTMITDWDSAWNTKDHVLASKWYSSNARFTNAFGDKMNGQKEIEKLLKEVFSLPFVMTGQSKTIDQNFQSIDNNMIIVHSAVVRVGQKTPDGIVMPERKTTHLRVFQRSKNGWEIIAHLISDARDKGTTKH